MTRRETVAYLGQLLTELDSPKLTDADARVLSRAAVRTALYRLNRPRAAGPVHVSRVLAGRSRQIAELAGRLPGPGTVSEIADKPESPR